MTSVSTGLTAAQADDVLQRKRALRLSMNAIRDALSPMMRAEAAGRLANLIDTDAFRSFLPPPGGIVAGYIAIRSEIDPLPLMASLADRGYRLALPRLEGSGMVFREWQIGDRLSEGPLKTREPSPTATAVNPDLVLTPLLAFDQHRIRLGYGMGYYDRYFHENPNLSRVGVAFACQEVDSVPHAPHDTALMAIFTEA